MDTLLVQTESKSYPIYFENDFSNLVKAISYLNGKYSNYMIISDSNVAPLYYEQVYEIIKEFGKSVYRVEFEAGEKNKTIESIISLYDQLIRHHGDRKTLILALGGGVVGDMAGFCAATYMRGVDFVQLPTTLLSQVDSSVGGKTGIDFNGYKNIIGSFYQPCFVYINVSTLQTLPKRELFAGMGEVIKHSFIRDYKYMQFLEQNQKKVMELDFDILKQMIRISCEIKKSVVDEDEKEQGVRALLNFGHTVGHAVERLKEFNLVHGECVAIGMHAALNLSKELGHLCEDEVHRALDLIQLYELPIEVTGLEAKQIYEELFFDKKTTNQQLMFALLNSLGTSYLHKESIDSEIILKAIDAIIKK